MTLTTVTLGRTTACGTLIKRDGEAAWVRDGSRVHCGRIVTEEWRHVVGMTGGFTHEVDQ